MKQKQAELEEEIESTRAIIQTYFASDIDIDELDYRGFLELAENDYSLICYWKDYKCLKAELKGIQETKAQALADVMKELDLDKVLNENPYLPYGITEKVLNHIKAKLKTSQETTE